MTKKVTTNTTNEKPPRRRKRGALGRNAPLDPNHLSVEQAAKLLSEAAKASVSVEQIAADLAAGAPRNPDGTINLVHYAAWLVREMGRSAGGRHRG